MRVLSWNFGYGFTFKRMHDGAWHWLAAVDPDLALVQEVHPPKWVLENWTVIEPSDPRWGSAIVAKSDLGLQAVELPAEVRATGGVAMAVGTVMLPDDESLLVISVHSPVMKARDIDLAGRDPASVKLPSSRDVWLRDVAYAVCRELVQGRRFLISGDWNVSPQLWDKRYGGTQNADFFARAERDGWIDCYRRFHTDEGRTWFNKGNAPYQFDHAFCDPVTADALKGCEIDAYAAELLQLSDHAPLVLTLDLAPAP